MALRAVVVGGRGMVILEALYINHLYWWTALGIQLNVIRIVECYRFWEQQRWADDGDGQNSSSSTTTRCIDNNLIPLPD